MLEALDPILNNPKGLAGRQRSCLPTTKQTQPELCQGQANNNAGQVCQDPYGHDWPGSMLDSKVLRAVGELPYDVQTANL